MTEPQTTASIEFHNPASGERETVSVRESSSLLGRHIESIVPISPDVAVVSRKHAEISKKNGSYFLTDLGSRNGTFLNSERLAAPCELKHGDKIQLGADGPVVIFRNEQIEFATTRSVRLDDLAYIPQCIGKLGDRLMTLCPFEDRVQLKVGRAADADIRLNILQVSNYHANFTRHAGDILVEDTNSTNGVYLNGERLSRQHVIRPGDVVQIGPFLLRAAAKGLGVVVYDPRVRTRIDAVRLTKAVQVRSSSGTIKLLDNISLTIQPNEFVGLLGPSGAGKSTLMDALNGMRPPSSGEVLINNLDYYRHLDALKPGIGYVPQDDIIHRELTVYRTLLYVARLRLSSDASAEEIEQVIDEVLEVTGLNERRAVQVGRLSGGQRKRVSIAVELITKPSVIFLDEPTSGLDPATEEKIMKLFRQLAESGRSVILTTHAMENVRLFDKIVVLMRGKLVFYGAPDEALKYVGAESFKELYDKLEEPIKVRISRLPPIDPTADGQRRTRAAETERITEEVADEWRQRFEVTEQHELNVELPAKGISPSKAGPPAAGRGLIVIDTLRQWRTLTHRYGEVLARDRITLFILFGQAPVIGFLLWLVVGRHSPRDFPYFVMALVAVWFGTSIAAREIVRERAVYDRERMVNLRLLPYIWSKVAVLSGVVGIQCFLLFVGLKAFELTGSMSLPGEAQGLPQLGIMLLTGLVGIALGLLISAIVKTSEMATSLVPLILIPQILFSGLVGVPEGVAKYVSAAMPAMWSFDAIKRLSTLDTLLEEGSLPGGETRGRGLFKHYEDLNKETINSAKTEIDKFMEKAERDRKAFERQMEGFERSLREQKNQKPPTISPLNSKPKVGEAQILPHDKSTYVNFLHPWGGRWRNPIVLLAMFSGLTLAAIGVLKRQDIRMKF